MVLLRLTHILYHGNVLKSNEIMIPHYRKPGWIMVRVPATCNAIHIFIDFWATCCGENTQKRNVFVFIGVRAAVPGLHSVQYEQPHHSPRRCPRLQGVR